MNLRILSEAMVETHRAAQWYEDRRIGLGEEFLARFAVGIEAIKKNPSRYSKLRIPSKKHIRRYLLEQFPFSIVYELRSQEILVIAVAHGSQRPAYWLGRGQNP